MMGDIPPDENGNFWKYSKNARAEDTENGEKQTYVFFGTITKG